MRPTIVPLLLTLLPACTADNAADTEGATAEPTTSAAATEPTTGDTTGEPADLNDRELGASASALCVSAMTHAAELTQAIASGDPTAASAAYVGTDLQTFVQGFKTEAERLDDPAIVASLTTSSPIFIPAAAAALPGRTTATTSRRSRGSAPGSASLKL